MVEAVGGGKERTIVLQNSKEKERNEKHNEGQERGGNNIMIQRRTHLLKQYTFSFWEM